MFIMFGVLLVTVDEADNTRGGSYSFLEGDFKCAGRRHVVCGLALFATRLCSIHEH